MSNFYTRMAGTAARLLTKYGQAMTLKRVTGGSIDPVTGAVTAGTTANLAVVGIMQRYPTTLIDGANILKSDRLVILSHAQTPAMTDKLLISSQEWPIIDIQTVAPAGTDLVYFVQVRQ